MGPLDTLEVNAGAAAQERLWLRGGFPDSYLAASDEDSFRLRQSVIRTYLERDVQQFGPRVPAETLNRYVYRYLGAERPRGGSQFTRTHRGNPVYSRDKYIATGWYTFDW